MELLEGTPPLFVLCVFGYIMMATVAFNMAGGLYRASGAFVFANASLTLIIGLCTKLFLGESADSNLRDPMTTILVYTAGMAIILISIFFSRILLPRRAFLDYGYIPEDTRHIAIGCIAIGIVLPTIASFLDCAPGTIGSAMNQFQLFAPLGLLLSIYDEIKYSGGRCSLNAVTVIGSAYIYFFGGVLATSKESLFTPLACYVVVCGALRFRLRWLNVASLALFCYLTFQFMVPYAQVVRNYTRDLPTFQDRLDGARYWLNRLDDVRAEYNVTSADFAVSRGPHYYSQDAGIMERFNMVAMDDALINITDINGTFGYRPIVVAIDNLIPHILWRNKPEFNFNNLYGHELGLLSYEDTTTCISFGPSADAYHIGKWPGVLLLMPAVLVLLFTMVDSVTGDIRSTPWGLTYTVFFLHSAPESMLGGCIDEAILTTGVLIVTVYLARYFLPLLASAFMPERNKSFLLRRAKFLSKSAG